MKAAPKLEDIMTAIGPAVETMVINNPGSKIIFTVCDIEMRRVAVGCREIAAALESGANRDNLLEVATYAEHIAQAMSRGADPDWIKSAKALCN